MPVETSVSQSAVYRARPTLRLAGQEDLRVSELLIGMRIEESEGGMTTAELRFSNWASTTDNRADHAFEGAHRLIGDEIVDIGILQQRFDERDEHQIVGSDQFFHETSGIAGGLPRQDWTLSAWRPNGHPINLSRARADS